MKEKKMLPSQKGNTGVTEKKSIFDFLSGEKDIGKEVQKIAHLFESVNIVERNGYSSGITLEKFISDEFFLSWEGRGTYLTPLELKTDMRIADIQEHTPSESQITLYLEYVINMTSMVNLQRYESEYSQLYELFSIKRDLSQALRDNITQILSQLNLKIIAETSCIFRLIPNDPVVTEAVEIVENPDVKLAILEYNHITNRDNLTGKRKILQILANDFEPKHDDAESKLKDFKSKHKDFKNEQLEFEEMKPLSSLISNLRFFFNNLNIRHNNFEGENAIPAIQNMPEKDLLEWYDTTYRLYLTFVLIYDCYCCNNEELQAKIKALRTAVKTR